MSGPRLSPVTVDTLQILAASIKTARLRKRWTIAQLAQRAGVSTPTMTKVERADPGVAIGTVFETARLVGVPLFDADPQAVARYGAHKRAELALLPQSARLVSGVDDDF